MKNGKFEVGDRIKVISNDNFNGFLGYIDSIGDRRKKYHAIVKLDEYFFKAGFNSKELEIVEEKPQYEDQYEEWDDT